MNKLFLLIIFSVFGKVCVAQTKIELKDVSKHIGDSVKLEGKVFGVKTFPDIKDAPILINLGADYPNQLLTIAVFEAYKTNVKEMPSEKLKGEIAIVRGKIELHKGKPQIVVRSADELYFATEGPIIVPTKN